MNIINVFGLAVSHLGPKLWKLVSLISLDGTLSRCHVVSAMDGLNQIRNCIEKNIRKSYATQIKEMVWKFGHDKK